MGVSLPTVVGSFRNITGAASGATAGAGAGSGKDVGVGDAGEGSGCVRGIGDVTAFSVASIDDDPVA